MNKEETIERYGEDAWDKHLAQNRAYYKAHKEDVKARNKEYREEHPEEVKAYNNEIGRKCGKHYDKHLKDMQTGLQGARNRIRIKHRTKYKQYKDIIATESQIHHEWIPETAEYRGIALVEKEPHQYGIINVIQILDGKITLLTEEEVREKKK